MSDKGGFRSSLFAGMNLGPSKVDSKSQSKGSTSLFENSGREAQLNESKSLSKESLHTKANVISSTSHGSSFSFITDSKTGEEKDMDGNSRNGKTSPEKSASVLELFDTLDGGGSDNTDEQLSLSYSDQLAEILPSTAPVDDALLTDIPEGGSDSSSDENAPEYEINNPMTESGCTVLQDENVDLNKVASKFPESNDIGSDENDMRESIDDKLEGPESNDDGLKDTTSIVSDVADSKYSLQLDPEEGLTLFYSQYSFNLSKLREEREELLDNICALYQDVKNRMVSLENQLSGLKTDFDEALNNDDYDLASEINEKLEELNAEKFELRSSRPKLLDKKIQDYLTCVTALREREREFHEWALTKYHDLQKQQSDLLEKHRQQCSNEINDKKQDLEHEKDEINRSLQHIQLDKKHLKKDKTDLDQRINTKLEVFQNKKEELVEKQIELGREIELLESRLKELRSEKTQVECCIKDENDKMTEVRKEFESEEIKLKEKCDNIEEKEKMLNRKLKEIFAKEKKLDLMAAEEQQKEESLVKNISSLTTNKEESETFIEKAKQNPDQNISDIFLTHLSQDSGDTLKRLRSSGKAKAKDLQHLELQVFNKEQNVSTKTKRLDEIQNQFPELEKAKKVAVTDHNFKEAKRLNEILKQLSNETETTRNEVELIKNTLTEDKEKTGVLKEEYATVKNDVKQAQENYDLAAIVRIVNKMKSLVDLDTSTDQDILLETIKSEEICLLEMEFKYFDAPSESFLSKLSESDQEKLSFMKEFLRQGTGDIR